MAETAAHLVDHVLPPVPYRQWVLTVPYRIRYLIAFDRDLCMAVKRIFMRAVMGWQRKVGKREGIVEGESGAVVFLQRFGSAINLAPHLHGLLLDGVFDDTGRFHLLTAPTDDDVAAVLFAFVLPDLFEVVPGNRSLAGAGAAPRATDPVAGTQPRFPAPPEDPDAAPVPGGAGDDAEGESVSIPPDLRSGPRDRGLHLCPLAPDGPGRAAAGDALRDLGAREPDPGRAADHPPFRGKPCSRSWPFSGAPMC